MSTHPYDAPPRTLNNRMLMMALAVVTLIAIIGPLVVFLSTRDDSTESVVSGVVEPTATPTAVPAAAAPAPTAAAPTAEPVAAPTAEATAAPAAAPAAPVAVAPTAAPVVPVASAPKAPVITALTGRAPAVYTVIGISSGSSLNVRESAGTTNPLIGTLARNATGVAGTGRAVSVDGSEWREIKFGSGTGWVFAGYLALAPAPVATSTPAPTATPETVQALVDDVPSLFTVTGVSTGASVNVRAEPGVTQRLLGTLAGNTSAVPATGRRSLVGQTEWREISFRNGFGWVDSSYLKAVPEAPQTVLLPATGPSIVGIVPLSSSYDRLVLRADPGFDKIVVATVGGSTVNVTATGQRAQIGTEFWTQITVLGSTGWVPQQLTTSSVRSASDVLASTGVTAVAIDKVLVGEDGVVVVQIGTQSLKVAANTTVVTSAGTQSSAADWAASAKNATTPLLAELTVSSNQVIRIWVNR